MNTIPEFYESIDRNAIIVRPKKPYFDWLNQLMPENKPITKNDENNIYLVREMESNEDVLKWVKRKFDLLFINELSDWDTDEEKWPQQRTYKMFSEWFEIEKCSMVLDLEEDPINKE